MLEQALIVASVAGGVLYSLWWARRLHGVTARWFNAGLEEAAQAHGVHWSSRLPHSPLARGRCGDLTVEIRLRASSGEEGEKGAHQLVARVKGGRLPSGVSFSRERGTGDDVLTGDPVFDDVVEVNGEPTVVLALFDARLRQQVSELVGLGGYFRNDEVVWEARTTFSSGEISHSLRVILAIAQALASPEGGGLCARLARNAARDPHPGVRFWNLSLLEAQFGDTPQAAAAARAAIQEKSPWLRLMGARMLREEGLAVLEQLATDDAIPDQAAAEAVGILAARQPAELAGPTLIKVLKARAGDARRQAVEELGRLRHAPAYGPLVVLLERAEARTAAAAAAALGSLGDPKAEVALLRAATSETRELRLEAVRALGTIGRVQSVEPLMARLEKGGLDTETRQALREAVAAIQSRLAGAEAGQVSLATAAPGVGWLSVASPGEAEGCVSLSDESDNS